MISTSCDPRNISSSIKSELFFCLPAVWFCTSCICFLFWQTLLKWPRLWQLWHWTLPARHYLSPVWDSLPHRLHSCFRLFVFGLCCLSDLAVWFQCCLWLCVVSWRMLYPVRLTLLGAVAWSCCLVASSVRAISLAFLSVRWFPSAIHFFFTVSESTPNTSASLTSWGSDR